MEYFGRGAADAAVLEISSFHLERSPTFRPRIAALLNITEDHLCRHGSFGEYAETKLRIFANQKESDWAVVNAGDPTVERALRDWRFSSAVVPFSAYSTLKDGLYLNGPCVEWRSGGRKEFYGMADAKLEGIHNMENIMATIAVCVLLGAGKENILKTTRSFRGLPHRMEFIREVDGVRYINDSKSTNVGSLLKALEGINGKAVVIAGGEDKGGDYAVLKELVREKVKLLVLIGRAKEKIKDALSGSTEAVTAGSLEEAVALARERASSGEAVILSPACASFDMFRNFEERGERFRTLVERL
jgi:UDP-N-acetylmuramoylalanine--D-glutamate ligase